MGRFYPRTQTHREAVEDRGTMTFPRERERSKPKHIEPKAKPPKKPKVEK